MEAKSMKADKEYTYADYLTWDENERYEIIDGVPRMQATPSRLHQKISVKLTALFYNYLNGKSCEIYHAPFSVVLETGKNNIDIKNVFEPDLFVVCDKTKLNDKGCIGAPDLIIEILSISNAKHDRITKFRKYEEAGVKEYWIVDPTEQIVTVFVLQNDGKYGKPELYSIKDDNLKDKDKELINEKIKVSIFEDLEIDLNSVF